MSFLRPKVYVPPPPPEAEAKERKKRRGRGSTIVAGQLDETSTSMSSTGGSPTLLG